MEKQPNIDKLFADKLRDLERNPRPEAWSKLETRLQSQTKKDMPDELVEKLREYERNPRPQAWTKLESRLKERENTKVLPLWWRYAAAASVMLMIGAGGWLLQNNKTNEINSQVSVSQNIKKYNPTNISPKTINKTTKNTVEIIQEKEVATIKFSPKSTIQGKEKNQNSAISHSSSPVQKLLILPVEKEQNQVARTISEKLDINTIQPRMDYKPETKSENTIVINLVESTDVAQNPKIENETIVVNLLDLKEENSESVADASQESAKKTSRLTKIWQQVVRAKKGENVDWNEVGFKPKKLLARADAKLDNTRESIANSLENIREKNQK
jgi:ribosomal protein L24E